MRNNRQSYVGTEHTRSLFFIEKGVRQGCILSPLLFCAYTEQVMREAEITESGAVIGGRSISNLRYSTVR